MKNTEQEATNLQELRLAQFTLQNATDMIGWLRKDGTFAYHNRAFLEVLGYTKAEMEKIRIYELDTTLSVVQFRDSWAKLEEERHQKFESEFQKKSGSTFPVEIQTHYIPFENEDFNCIFVQDISERKLNEMKLQKALTEVKATSQNLQSEVEVLQQEINLTYNFRTIISNSPLYRHILAQVEQVATTDATVLITGESGTGKELIARALHGASKRSKKPLVKVNCAALPSELFESELFGHEKGSFTDAHQQKIGRFELANNGTIFLDEIGEMPLHLQPKLLRVLQEGEFDRIGGTKTIHTDVRIIAATNRNLEKMVEAGKFREDLYYRLNVFPIHNPPLRDRMEDVRPLVKHFMLKYAQKAGKVIDRFSEGAITRLEKYSFPGNIRELENIVERSVVLTKSRTLNLEASLPKKNAKKVAHNPHINEEDEENKLKSFEELQRDHILLALKQTGWRVTGAHGAARLLGLNDRTLASKMRKFEIHRANYYQ